MKYIQKIFSSLGTLNLITLYYKDEALKAKEVMGHIEDYCNRMDDRLSVFKETSEVSTINKMSGIGSVKVSPDTFELIKISKTIAEETDGAFDITMKPVVDLWFHARAAKSIPSKSHIKEALRKVDYKDLILNERQRSVMLKNKGEQIDLGGIAKGYILDKIKEMIIENGFSNAIINLGGTVSGIGEKRKIGIRNPFTPMNQNPKQEIALEVESEDEDIVTSGAYEQFIDKNGKKYHHILNPHSGYPTETEIISATLIGKNGAELDALATACLVLGLEKSNQLINSKRINAIFILNDGKIFYTEELISKIYMKGI